MTNEFIPYEQALELKELGFDEDCFGYYVNTELDLTWKFSDCSLYQNIHNSTLAPLYQQAFRWFREKYNIKSYILPQLVNEVEKYTFHLVNNKVNLKFLVYETHEEAELSCLKQLINIVKNKNNEIQ